jgi:hypothetical protein
MNSVHAAVMVFVSLVGIATARADTVLHYEPATVTLTGTVRLEQHFGPPNFGENPRTDQRVQVAILVLDAPVDVEGNRVAPGQPPLDTTTYRRVQRVQLIGANAATLNGRHVSASGKLFEKIAAGQYTDVLLQVEGLR